MKSNYLTILLVVIAFLFNACNQTSNELPNILWLTSEDNSPLLGCYGDDFATTPNLDQLAAEGFLYTHAYANAPVCAPTRNTIASGVYACSGGHSNMRSFYKRSDEIKFHAEVMRELGYYCSNNVKTDYNTNVAEEIWDDCSNTAHYKNRPEGKPFFAIFNTTISHESCIHKSIPNRELRHSADEVPIPPYHPKTEEMKHDWAQYYDKVEDMDDKIGHWLQELEDEGLAENTIVFYYGDHGGVLGRSKRYVYETGTRVPFIVRIPQKYRKLWPSNMVGSKIDRLISFVDLFPTLISIAGAKQPSYLQGNAFLGDQKTEEPQYAYMFRDRMDEWYDMSRSVRDQKFRYIRNYMPYRPYGLPIEYLWRAPSMQSWEHEYLNGNCDEIQSRFWEQKPVEELYDTENDPWEINNLAHDSLYADVLKRLRQANYEWLVKIKDTGFMPEADRIDRAGNKTLYDYCQSSEFNIEPIIKAAELASLGEAANGDKMIEFLKSNDPAIRYWGATGILFRKTDSKKSIEQLKIALNDSALNVVVVASEALYRVGEVNLAIDGLIKVLNMNNEHASTHALNTIAMVNEQSQRVKDEVFNLFERIGDTDKRRFDYRACLYLLDKWGMKPLNAKVETH